MAFHFRNYMDLMLSLYLPRAQNGDGELLSGGWWKMFADIVIDLQMWGARARARLAQGAKIFAALTKFVLTRACFKNS